MSTQILNHVAKNRIKEILDSTLVGDGVSVFLGDSKTLSGTPNNKEIISQAPDATILVKKKAFSTIKQTNDLQWMDRTEKMLLRATKALFSYKVTQLRTYESLTKVDNTFKKYQELNLTLFADLLHNAQFLSVADPDPAKGKNFFSKAINTIGNVAKASLKEIGYEGYKQDILKIMERNAFANDNQLTTWIVDPNDVDNYSTGPGTGVIEVGSFLNFGTETSIATDPSRADFTVEDPYRILTISEQDIEIAIQEALEGTVGLFEELITGTLVTSSGLGQRNRNYYPGEGPGGIESGPPVGLDQQNHISYGTGYNAPILDTNSIVSAGAALLGLGGLDGGLDMNYVRDRLRTFYLGRTIFNPGDGVHFYIRGNKLSETNRDGINVVDEGFLEIDANILRAEWHLFTDKKIPYDTYKKIRFNEFEEKSADSIGELISGLNSLSMRHVFGGFIVETSEVWNQGYWNVKVNCTDNMGWLQWSRFNINPALQDPQGILEDPLTPFELKKDDSGRELTAEGPQLLEENKSLLKSGLLSYDSGILNGQVATENNLLQGQYNLGGGSLGGTKILQHPHGLVYRWKTGIFTATQGLDVVDPLDETLVSIKKAQKYGLPATTNVLNNLDIANILSFLIVGQPYNVETFMQQAYDAHNIRNQSSTSSMSSEAPLSGVLDVIRRNNNSFGHFRPYRMLTLSKATVEQSANASDIREKVNKNIVILQERRLKINKLIKNLRPTENNPLLTTLKQEIKSINAGIQKEINIINGGGNISASDILTSNFNIFGQNRALPLSGNPEFDHEITRAMMIVGAQRRIEDVRLNRDQNLFIVSDQYEENTDIRPYLFKIRSGSYKMFEGEFVSVYEKAKEANKLMHMEFFCNPDGHLEFRPPQWNKTPLSVLRRLLQINKETGGGGGVVPSFLSDLFQTRTETFKREIHSLNVRIVLIALLLGKYPDRSLIPGIESSGKNSLEFFGITQTGVKDDEQKSLELKNGQNSIGLGSLVDTGDQLFGFGIKISGGIGGSGDDDDDILDGDTSTILGVFDPIFQEQNSVLSSVRKAAASPSSGPANSVATAENLNNIRDNFRNNYGLDPGSGLADKNKPFDKEDFVFNISSDGDDSGKKLGAIKKYLKKLSVTISDRDKLVTALARNEAKKEELDEIESILSGEFTDTGGDDEQKIERKTQFGKFIQGVEDGLDAAARGLTKVSNAIGALTDILSGEATKGSLFDHLIANDERNLLGPGSGKRFIIRDVDIISCTFSEKPPNRCRVDVVGNAPIIGDGLQKNFDNRYFWAGATDFDLWRQYGYKAGATVDLPFANSSELQCRPFSIFELQIERVKINQGTIQVVGNEFYAPGDVVYIPEKGLLYYIRAVSHSFSFGGDFTTTLQLENGHPPGVYLPSPLDIIGQQLTKSPISGSILTYRNQKGDDDYRPLQPDSAIIFPISPEISSSNIAVLLDHKDNQVRLVNMMINLSTVLIGNRKVLIRGFVKSENDPDIDKVRKNIDIVKSLIQNPLSITQDDPRGLGDDLLDGASGIFRGLGAGTGTTKGVQPLTLPNGIQIRKISSEDIFEQIVILNKGEGASNNVSKVECFNPSILTNQESGGFIVSPSDFQAAFPKGGPKQRTWLDLRDDLTQVSNIIEVGILDVTRAINTAGKADDKKEFKLL